MAIIKTSSGNNNKTSHYVGYESSRFRYECFKFEIPEFNDGIPVISATLIGGTFANKSSACGLTGTEPIFYYGIASRTSETITTDYSSKVKYGTVSFDEVYPTLVADINLDACVLAPGKYNLYVYTEVAKYGYRAFRHDNGAELEFVYTQYTKCSPPDSITTNSVFAKPGGSFTINWSGAIGGSANDISGYEIQYKIGDKEWGEVYSSLGQSHTLILPTETINRGDWISARVRTIGKAGGIYNSDYFTQDGVGKVNTLPGAPIIKSVSKSHIPSTGGQITFLLTKGQDADGQNISLKYGNSDSTPENERKSCNESFVTDNITQNTSFYFWSYDGIEYSEGYAYQNIVKNTEPKMSVNIDGAATEQQILSFVPIDGFNNNSYSVGYFLYEDQNIIKQDTIATNIKSTSYQVDDIREYLSPLNEKAAYSYTFWAKRNDGIEESKTVESGKFSFNTVQIESLVGLDDSGQPVLELSGYFEDLVKVKVNNVANYGYVNNVSLSNFEAIISLGNSDRGKSPDVLRFRRDSNSPEFEIKLIDRTLSRIKAIVFENLIFEKGNSLTPFKPYSQATLEFSMPGMDENYGVAPGNLPLEIIYNNGDAQESVAIDSLSGSGPDLLLYKLTPEELWGEKGLARINIAESESIAINIRFRAKNLYGGEFISNPFPLYFDFREPVMVKSWSLYPGKVEENNEPYPIFENWEFIKESMPIFISCEFNFYNSNPQLSLNNNGIVGNYIQNFEHDYSISPWQKTDTGGWQSTPKTIYVDTDTGLEFGAFSQDGLVEFQLSIKTNANIQTIESYQALQIKRHSIPTAHLIELQYDGTDLTGKWIIDDCGYDTQLSGAITSQLVDKNTQNITNIPQGPDQFFNIKYSFGESTYRHFASLPTSTLSARTRDGLYVAFSTSKTAEDFASLVYIICYNLLPTIAYRANRVGINTSDPGKSGDKALENSAFTVSAYNDSNKIYFTSANNIGSIDLVNGAMNSFWIDAGSWSGIPGQVIPGQGEVPTNLAQIAYTGEMADLEQDSTITIILCGGSSVD